MLSRSLDPSGLWPTSSPSIPLTSSVQNWPRDWPTSPATKPPPQPSLASSPKLRESRSTYPRYEILWWKYPSFLPSPTREEEEPSPSLLSAAKLEPTISLDVGKDRRLLRLLQGVFRSCFMTPGFLHQRLFIYLFIYYSDTWTPYTLALFFFTKNLYSRIVKGRI